jgi:alkylation response protein AidB-like acyl-CoA dehydrogenase
MSAGVPEELDGLGVEAVQDLVAGVSRLARGDGSTAIAANMHIGAMWNMSRRWRAAVAAGDGAAASRLEIVLRGLGNALVCAIGAESGTAAGYPLTEASRVNDGWRLNGRKVFGTLSPVAGVVIVSCRARDAGGEWRSAYAFVGRNSPGLVIHDDWDALGMRASGSNSVEFTDCLVPEHAVRVEPTPWGQPDPLTLTVEVSTNLCLTAAMLGIAEQAHRITVEHATTHRKAPSGRLLAESTGIQYQMAELEIDLATARAMIETTARRVDEALAANGSNDLSLDELQTLMLDFQCTKWVANRKCMRVVDAAMAMSGGVSYLNASTLSRLYRDVRAGPFMQAHSPNEAREYIGRSVLGLNPDVDR